jgi:hypothetical protein
MPSGCRRLHGGDPDPARFSKDPEKYVSSTVSAGLKDRWITINQQILSSTRMQKIIDDFWPLRQGKEAFGARRDSGADTPGPLRSRSNPSQQQRPGAFRNRVPGSDPIWSRPLDHFVRLTVSTAWFSSVPLP